MLPRVAIPGLLAAATACAPPADRGGWDNPNPAAKMYAIEQAIRSGDRSTTPHLVEQLDSDDPAVRLLAISALTGMWHDDLGYCYDDPLPQRNAAVLRWREAVSSGRFGPGREPADG